MKQQKIARIMNKIKKWLSNRRDRKLRMKVALLSNPNIIYLDPAEDIKNIAEKVEFIKNAPTRQERKEREKIVSHFNSFKWESISNYISHGE